MMEQERFFTGYCRQLDQSRMVCVVWEDGEITECDCLYGNCLYQQECPVGRQIWEASQEMIP